MAGRGRGSQFASISDGLGLGRGRMDLQNTDPPPVYPPLGSRPHYPQMLPENDYMLAVMKDFTNQMRDSQFAISASDNDSYNKGIVIERFSDKPQVSWLLVTNFFFTFFQCIMCLPLMFILTYSGFVSDGSSSS